MPAAGQAYRTYLFSLFHSKNCSTRVAIPATSQYLFLFIPVVKIVMQGVAMLASGQAHCTYLFSLFLFVKILTQG